MSTMRRGIQALSRTATRVQGRRAGFLTIPRRSRQQRAGARGGCRAAVKTTVVAAVVAGRMVSVAPEDDEASGPAPMGGVPDAGQPSAPAADGAAPAGFGGASASAARADADPPAVDADGDEIPGLDLEGLLAVSKQFATPEFLAQVGFGGAMGFCAGYALKKVGRTAVLAVGLTFVGLQAAIHYKVLRKDAVDWEGIKEYATKALDTDGDGTVSAADIKVHWKRLVKMLGFNMGSAAAFGGAMLLGLHSG